MKLLFHGVGHYPAGVPFGPACWPNLDLFVVREGEMLFHTERGEMCLLAGDAVLIPPLLEFRGMATTKHSAMWVCHFQNRSMQLGKLAPEITAGVGLFRSGVRSDLAGELMERIHQIYLGDNRWPDLAETYFSALLTELIRNSQRHTNAEEQWFHELEKWTRKHLHEQVGIRELARHSGLSSSHFRKLFLKRRGISAGRFLLDLRLSEAKNLLQQSSLTLKEIAFQTGYSDAVAFHHAFLREARITPSNFRKCKLSAV